MCQFNLARPGRKVVFNSEQQVTGFYQKFGVSANDEKEILELIRKYLAKDLDSELVEVADQWSPDLFGIDRDVADQIGQMDKVGIWYSSGRAWFGLDEEES